MTHVESEARERLLTTATGLFYAAGIRAVGVDRVLAEAGVARGTFYRHFPGKEDLVAAYLGRIDDYERRQVDAVQANGEPAATVLRHVAAWIVEGVRSTGFRGCAFINAAAEYPDADNAVHRAVLQHRAWFEATIIDLFAKTGQAASQARARHFVMLRDGVMSGGCLGDPQLAGETFLRGVEGLLTVDEDARDE